ncbi:hypothetical protein BH11PSE11_BH11PSE11_25520 [soil metagenome]
MISSIVARGKGSILNENHSYFKREQQNVELLLAIDQGTSRFCAIQPVRLCVSNYVGNSATGQLPGYRSAADRHKRSFGNLEMLTYPEYPAAERPRSASCSRLPGADLRLPWKA